MDAYQFNQKRDDATRASPIGIEVDSAVESLHKKTIKPIITPLLSVYTVILIIFDFSVSWRWASVVGIAAATALFNISRDSKPIHFRFFGKTLNLGMDASDAVRWGVNITLTDIPLTFLLGLSGVALAGFWSLVVISIIAEIHNPKYRYPVFAYALIASTVAIYLRMPEMSGANLFFWNANLLALSAFFLMMEIYWKKAIIEKMESDKKLTETVRWADELYRNAIVAQHARVISHEVANLAMGINLISQNQKEWNELASIRSSVGYLQRVTRLVLDDLQEDPLQHICSLDKLLDDVSLVLGKPIIRKGIQWKVTCDSSLSGCVFSERAGSTFLILQNLVKNASESIQRRHVNLWDGVIQILVTRQDDGFLMMVEDNGHGLTADMIQRIKKGNAMSDRENGHGLGLRFVFNECNKNGFVLHAGNCEGGGARIGISVKITASPKV
jgi:signal transduction histidine kinase